jgi:hypothetical protein
MASTARVNRSACVTSRDTSHDIVACVVSAQRRVSPQRYSSGAHRTRPGRPTLQTTVQSKCSKYISSLGAAPVLRNS